jgi:hypothetical protein
MYPKLIRNTFPFGKRTLTIVYEKTETGGSCITTCHKQTKYDRYDPFKNNMRVSPRLGKDVPIELLQSNKAKSSDEQEGTKDIEKPQRENIDTDGNVNTAK